jgi:N6-L-threonylcarbamoyladenine synthase
VRSSDPSLRSGEPAEGDRADLARGFQDAALEVLVAKTVHAVESLGYRSAMIGGGVACNRTLTARLTERLAGRARVSVASPRLNTDNAAMIAAAGAWRLARGERSGWELEPRDDLPLPGLIATPSYPGTIS